MTFNGWIQIAIYFALILVCVKPLGLYMARVFNGERTFLTPVFRPVERGLYRLCGVDETQEQHWIGYTVGMLLFSLASFLLLYGLQRLQAVIPLFNPAGMAAVSPDSSFNTSVSFTTNTNWQGYGGETTMSYLTQMAGLTVQNFVSATVGIVLAIALVRGFARRQARTVGNFWVDLTRGVLYVMLPMSIVVCLALVALGVPQNLAAYTDAATLEGAKQVIAQGPAASQIAIKQLGTNGGGFFNVNSAHPFENPTPLSNFLEVLAILVISGALCYSFGKMVGDTRQGWAILAAMTFVFVVLLALCVGSEQAGNPALSKLGVDQTTTAMQPGANMEGKETRFGIVNSALWATATTSASNGSVNAMHDSFTPLGGLVPMWLMQLGEVIFGGVGSGLYGMLIFAIVAVFVAGLMIGRTPEYLGKKIEAFEMKMAAIAVLMPLIMALGWTAVAVVMDAGKAGVANPGAHGFSEILYAFSSASNNNGSAFAGIGANTPYYNLMLGLAMLVGRFVPAIPVLAIAGSLAKKKSAPPGLGTLPTHGLLFVLVLVGTVLLVGALTFLPALALGPIVEHLMMVR